MNEKPRTVERKKKKVSFGSVHSTTLKQYHHPNKDQLVTPKYCPGQPRKLITRKEMSAMPNPIVNKLPSLRHYQGLVIYSKEI